jgi:hypothetical protein
VGWQERDDQADSVDQAKERVDDDGRHANAVATEPGQSRATPDE